MTFDLLGQNLFIKYINLSLVLKQSKIDTYVAQYNNYSFPLPLKTIHFGTDSKIRDFPYFRVEDFGGFFVCCFRDHIEMHCEKIF